MLKCLNYTSSNTFMTEKVKCRLLIYGVKVGVNSKNKSLHYYYLIKRIRQFI